MILTKFYNFSNQKQQEASFLPLIVGSLAFFFLIPTLCVVGGVFVTASDVWEHLLHTTLWQYVQNSFFLFIGVSLMVFIIGTITAAFVSMTDFPGKKIFEWALVLPLAMPAYVMAYAYTDFLQFTGPFQILMRDMFGWSYGDYWFPNIRSLGGAVFVFSFSLYPYVYLLAKSAFQSQSMSLLEVSRTLHCSTIRSFFKIILPLARPAIVAGIALVLMETLADFGTVSYFGIQTFTTGIYRAWLSMGDMIAAIKLSACLLGLIIFLFFIERYNRSHARYHETSTRHKYIQKTQLTGITGGLACFICGIPILCGFIIPVCYLFYLLFDSEQLWLGQFAQLIYNSFLLAALTAILAVVISLFFVYSMRIYNKSPLSKIAIRMVSFGYALPGSILAIGALIPFAWMDTQLNVFFKNYFDITLGLILSGSVFILIFSYLVRFITISIHTMEASLGKVTHNMDSAARSLGAKPLEIITKIHIPLIKNGIFTAMMIVFVEVLKELPATLILRPFNFDTLAVRAYQLASDERLAEAALPSLTIILVSLIPVIMLSKTITSNKKTA